MRFADDKSLTLGGIEITGRLYHRQASQEASTAREVKGLWTPKARARSPARRQIRRVSEVVNCIDIEWQECGKMHHPEQSRCAFFERFMTEFFMSRGDLTQTC
jgi:hypothetical protein